MPLYPSPTHPGGETIAPVADVPGLTVAMPAGATSPAIQSGTAGDPPAFSVTPDGIITAGGLSLNALAVNNLYDGDGNVLWASVDAGAGAVALPLLTDLAEQSAPASPSAGSLRVYAGTDHALHTLTSSGTDTALGSGGGGGNTISSTAIGSEPSSPATGDMDRYTNAAVVARYNGTDWNSTWGPTWPLTRPRLADWTAINQSTATIAERGGGIGIDTPALSGENWRALVRSTPATPYTLTVAWLATPGGANGGAGLALRQSSDGKLMIFRYLYANTLIVSQFASATSYNNNVSGGVSTGVLPPTPFVWLQLNDNGTNRIWRYSLDGVHFVDAYSEARTTYLTADQWGFCCNSGGSAFSALWLHAGVS